MCGSRLFLCFGLDCSSRPPFSARYDAPELCVQFGARSPAEALEAGVFWGVSFVTHDGIASSLIMISLGIIGFYVARIYEEIKGRPRYIVADVCGREESAE